MTAYNEKPVFADNTTAMNDLEAMVDAAGMRNVLYALEHIAFAKAEHIEHSWQDHELAKAWRKAARVSGRAASNRLLDVS